MDKITPITRLQTREELVIELNQLYDDFSTFSDDCAFLCDAFASMVGEDCTDGIDAASSRGMANQARWLKLRVSEFKQVIKQIQSDV